MIHLAGIERIFRVGGEEVHALRAIDLEIGQGEYLSIMGPSGSGKSSLLNIIGLLDRPNAGRYTLDGRDVTGLSDDEQARVRREKIGFVFQFFHLVPRLTAAQNIELERGRAFEGVGGNGNERGTPIDPCHCFLFSLN